MINLVHLITGLSRGGAEAMLVKLLAGIDRRAFRCTVISLVSGGVNRAPIEAMGIDVHELGMTPGVPSFFKLMRLRRLIARASPDIVHGWMYHGALAALVAAPRRPIVIGIRASLHDVARESLLTRSVIGLVGRMSGRAARVCYASETSRRQHEAAGYDGRRALVLPNGFDCAWFAPRPADRAAIRAELGIGADELLIGHLGRHHPVKDHQTLIDALALLATRRPRVRVAAAGPGVTPDNPALAGPIAALGLADRVRLLGDRDDPARLLNGFDLFVSSSRSEAFSNVLGESMACGVSCVATAVGDSPLIVGDTGALVPPADAPALAAAMEKMIDLGVQGLAQRGAEARQRIVDHFSIEQVTAGYEALYRGVIAERGGDSSITAS